MKKVILLLSTILCCMGMVLAQGPAKVGVYVTGEVNAGNKKIVGQKMVSGLAADKELAVSERTNNIIAELAKDRNYKTNAPVNVERVCEIARDMGLTYVAIADLTDAMGSLVISAQIVDAAHGENMAIADESVKINNANDLMRCVDKIAKQLLEGLDAKLHPVVVEPEPESESKAEAVSESAEISETDANNKVTEVVIPLVEINLGIDDLQDKNGDLPEAFKNMVRNKVVSTMVKIPGYKCYDFLTTEERPQTERTLVLEANKLDGDKLSIAFKVLDNETLQILQSGQVNGTVSNPAIISDLLCKEIRAVLTR